MLSGNSELHSSRTRKFQALFLHVCVGSIPDTGNRIMSERSEKGVRNHGLSDVSKAARRGRPVRHRPQIPAVNSYDGS